ncbi:MAG: type II secretion system F family protein [Candidatus Aenigmarchaeota archaeon]|nr:type II secretion system F family protein [Candidatus Aenigmarchaeota archaeon]
MKRIPFIPLGMVRAKRVSHRFLGFGETMSKMFPSMEFHLHQSGLDFDSREWLGLAFFVSLIYFILLLPLTSAVIYTIRPILQFAFGIGFAVSAGIAVSILFYFSMYPRLMVKRKVKDIEGQIPHVLNHLLVEVRSGVTMFNAMSAIAYGGYGRLSKEFGKAVTDINTGMSEIDALEKITAKTPSLFFRRVIWQMVNAMRSGADIGDILKEIVDNITADQKTALKKYGSELNPLSLFYMMLVIIFPTLGIVFSLVMFSFIGVEFSIELLLVGMLALISVVQVMFVGLIKNKRPVGI